jgi:hypothetical protein
VAASISETAPGTQMRVRDCDSPIDGAGSRRKSRHLGDRLAIRTRDPTPRSSHLRCHRASPPGRRPRLQGSCQLLDLDAEPAETFERAVRSRRATLYGNVVSGDHWFVTVPTIRTMAAAAARCCSSAARLASRSIASATDSSIRTVGSSGLFRCCHRFASLFGEPCVHADAAGSAPLTVD